MWNELRPFGGPFPFDFWLAPPILIQAGICLTIAFVLLVCGSCLRNEICEGTLSQVGENLVYKTIRSETSDAESITKWKGAAAQKTIVR